MSKAALVVLVVAAVSVSACGRRGALEPPPLSLASQPGHVAEQTHTATEVEEPAPRKPFLLDFLL